MTTAARAEYIRAKTDRTMTFAGFYDIARRLTALGHLGETVLGEVILMNMATRVTDDVRFNLWQMGELSASMYRAAKHNNWPLELLPVYNPPESILEEYSGGE